MANNSLLAIALIAFMIVPIFPQNDPKCGPVGRTNGLNWIVDRLKGCQG